MYSLHFIASLSTGATLSRPNFTSLLPPSTFAFFLPSWQVGSPAARSSLDRSSLGRALRVRATRRRSYGRGQGSGFRDRVRAAGAGVSWPRAVESSPRSGRYAEGAAAHPLAGRSGEFYMTYSKKRHGDDNMIDDFNFSFDTSSVFAIFFLI